MANLPPNHNEFAPAAEAAPDNMNEWILPYPRADPLYPPPPASDSESEIEFEEAEAEAEVAPIPPPVPANPEPETATIGTGRLTPLKRLFTDTQIENDDMRAENKRLRMMLDCKSITVENLLPPHLQYQEPPYALPKTLLAPVTHNDPRDPYVAVRDAATAPATDD
ncbi:hypothetical protein Tco_1187333 [Tanacetum coccineum]